MPRTQSLKRTLITWHWKIVVQKQLLEITSISCFYIQNHHSFPKLFHLQNRKSWSLRSAFDRLWPLPHRELSMKQIKHYLETCFFRSSRLQSSYITTKSWTFWLCVYVIRNKLTVFWRVQRFNENPRLINSLSLPKSFQPRQGYILYLLSWN